MAIHPGKAIRELLIDSTGVSDIVGTRIFPQFVPQNRGFEQQSRIVYHRISADHEHHFASAAGLAHARIQLDLYGHSTGSEPRPDYERAQLLAERCRSALDGYQNSTVSITGTTESLAVEYIHLENELDGTDPPTDNSHVFSRRVIQDYRIGYQLSVPTFA